MAHRLERLHADADPRTLCRGQLIPVAIRAGRVWRGVGWICLHCGGSARRAIEDIRRIRDGETVTPAPALHPWSAHQ